jgi:hypothetical protein
MHGVMARSAKRNQIFFLIIAGLAPEVFVVNLKVGHRLLDHDSRGEDMDKALRYQRAAARDFYRALNELYKTTERTEA